MTENQLLEYMKKCHHDNEDAAILIPNKEHLEYALNLLINGCNGSIRALILFDESNNKSHLFDIINKNQVIINIMDFLKENNTSLHIVTNKQKLVRESPLYKRINLESNPKRSMATINSIKPERMKQIKDDGLDHEFIIGTPSSALLFVPNDNNENKTNPDIPEDIIINFGDKPFHDLLSEFISRASSGKIGVES
ncbi:hypothetical protein ACET5Y_16145 [Aeromonas veronii]